MDKMDEITRRLAAQQPTLSDPDALTDSIMAHLPMQTKPRGQQFLRAVRWISSVAAVGLLVLFVSQSHDLIQRPDDIDYGQTLQQLRSENTQLPDDLTPREALRKYVELKRSRTNISDIKRHFSL